MDFLKNIKPRKYQEEIYKTCIDNNCLVVLPTGLGKTLIALMLTINRIKKYPKEKVLFLAPTKPLIEQHLNYFKNHLPELFGDMQLFTGAIKAEERKKIWQTADIIFSTPQCISNDLKKNFYDLKNVSLLIEDEAHRCVKNYSYNFVARKYIEQAEHPRILGTTASPGYTEKKIKEISKNLSINKIEIRTRDSKDVVSYIQKRSFQKITLELPKEFQEIRNILKVIFNEYIDALKKRKLLYGYPTKKNLIELQKKIFISTTKRKDYNYLIGASLCASAIKISYAIELLETQTLFSFNNYLKELFKQAKEKKSKGVIKLVSNPKFNLAFIKLNELLSKKVEHPKVSKTIEIIKEELFKKNKKRIIIFSQFRSTSEILSKELNKINGINSNIFIGQAKKNGVGLNQKEQKQIIKDFSNNKINVLCSTSIGEEGLDIPEVDTVIFYEPIPSAIRTIQRAGRTARIKIGKLIFLITKSTRDEAYFYISKQKERKMKESIEKIKYKKKETQKKINEAY